MPDLNASSFVNIKNRPKTDELKVRMNKNYANSFGKTHSEANISKF